MNCEGFGARLTAYSLGELPDTEAGAARAHLARCDRCATLVLRDRELVGRMRASAVPAPASLHSSVRLALRRERSLRRKRLMRRAGALAAAAALAGVVSSAPSVQRTSAPAAPAALPAVKAPAPGPLAAAWSAYQAPVLPIERAGAGDPLLLGFTPTVTDLDELGLRLVAAGTVRLAGKPAFATEYRDDDGERLTLFRWKGTLPDAGGDYPSGSHPELQITRNGLTSSAWWDNGEVVYCAVGDLEQDDFEEALSEVRGTA